MTPTFLAHQNKVAFTHNENTYTETHLMNQIYSIMILTIKIHLHLMTNTQHYYNKNYRIHIEIHMTQ